MRVLLLFALLASSAFAEDLYLASANTGSADGSSCANARIYTWFNTSGNWGVGAGKISAGDTVHLCGTITGSAGETMLTAQASGTSGNPITILFEANAKISAPYLNYNGGIVLNKDYIVLDGGTNGIIENTANGTAFANQQSSMAILAYPCNNCEIKNLTIQNIYVHTGTNNEVNHVTMNALTFSGQNVLVHHNTVIHAGWAIWSKFGDNDVNHQIYNNTITNVDHSIILAGTGVVVQNYLQAKIYNNVMRDFSNWDAANNGYHHDGVHLFGGNTASQYPTPRLEVYIYNNECGGSLGTGMNACFFMEGNNAALNSGTPWSSDATATWYFFNNLIFTSEGHPAVMAGAGTNNFMANNTVIGTGGSDQAFQVSGMSNILSKNNAMSALSYFNLWSTGLTVATPATDVATNAYSGCVGFNCFNWSGQSISTASFATWQSQSGADVASIYSSDLMHGVTGHPLAGSPLIGGATNLTSVCSGNANLSALCRDKAGVQRPASGAWDIGAYQYAAPPPPSTISGSVLRGVIIQ